MSYVNLLFREEARVSLQVTPTMHDLDDLRGWNVLKDIGWKDAQDVAWELWGQEHMMTFRDTTITDHILLSPELIPLLREVQGWHYFADHLALGVRLEVPPVKQLQNVWP